MTQNEANCREWSRILAKLGQFSTEGMALFDQGVMEAAAEERELPVLRIAASGKDVVDDIRLSRTKSGKAERLTQHVFRAGLEHDIDPITSPCFAGHCDWLQSARRTPAPQLRGRCRLGVVAGTTLMR